jgi:hypothetical protein
MKHMALVAAIAALMPACGLRAQSTTQIQRSIRDVLGRDCPPAARLSLAEPQPRAGHVAKRCLHSEGQPPPILSGSCNTTDLVLK